MNKLVSTLAALVAFAAIGTAAPAFAEQVKYMAALSSAEEVPPTNSAATGTVDATFDTETKVLTWTITYDGLTGDATAAHFHGPAAPGANAGPQVPIEGPLTSPISGTATLTDAQAADLAAGMWYFNVHTAQHPDGEIRGQVVAGDASKMIDASSSSAM
ncbi:MAG: CHRD domain-containing protein [Devosia sp.]